MLKAPQAKVWVPVPNCKALCLSDRKDLPFTPSQPCFSSFRFLPRTRCCFEGSGLRASGPRLGMCDGFWNRYSSGLVLNRVPASYSIVCYVAIVYTAAVMDGKLIALKGTKLLICLAPQEFYVVTEADVTEACKDLPDAEEWANNCTIQYVILRQSCVNEDPNSVLGRRSGATIGHASPMRATA